MLTKKTKKKDGFGDTKWLSEDITAAWYPPPISVSTEHSLQYVLPKPKSVELATLIRALEGLAQLKRRTGFHDEAEATQLRLVGTLRAGHGMHSERTINACRELAWMYKHSKKAGDAIGVLARSLELVEASRSIRGQKKIELVSALCEDLSSIYRERHQYVKSVKYAEKAVRTLEQGEGGRNNPRCGVLWTAITSDWAAIEGMSTGNIEEVYFAAKEAVRVASTTFPAHTEVFSPESWQCAAHSNMLAVLLARNKIEKAVQHLEQAAVLCPNVNDNDYLEHLTGLTGIKASAERGTFYLQPKVGGH